MTQATHEDLSRTDDAKPGSDRAFGITMAVVAAVFAMLGAWRGAHWWPWLAAISMLMLSAAALYPSILHPFNVVWFRFGMLLHSIVSPIVMALLFFAAIFPTGVMMRLAGKNLLRLRRPKDEKTYWISRQPQESGRDSMREQF